MEPSGRPLRQFVPATVGTVLVVGALVVGALLVADLQQAEGSATQPAGIPSPPASMVTTPSADARPPGSTADARPPGSTADARPSGSSACDGTPVGPPAAEDVEAAVRGATRQGDVSVAVSWIDPQQGVRSAGELTDLPAWSTSKVPLALAVMADGDGEPHRRAISAALRSSDNAAADTLWRALGPDDSTRARAVTQVLRQAGDRTTTVPGSQLFAPYSVYGQTQWATADQVRFLQQLPCLEGSSRVIEDMGAVDRAQRWGLGTRAGATFKGGWGPSPDGGYTVRQFGWYTDSDGGRVPMAVAVRAGSFDDGVAVLDDLAGSLG